MSADREGPLLEGLEAVELAERLGLPGVVHLAEVASTLDVAHDLAARGAEAGTLVIADSQTAGRGRQGRRWTSDVGGLWLTLVERPRDPRALDVLALRCGLEAAEALEPLADGLVRVKWPNDLYLRDGKLAGILIETRWRGEMPEWVAIGFGLNIGRPERSEGPAPEPCRPERSEGPAPFAVPSCLSPSVSRVAALDALVPALRRAAAARGPLTDAEIERWRKRDLAAGRIVTEPAEGMVQGISAAGELLVMSNGRVAAHRSGSLTFAAPISCS